jgi:hypothetical protein
MDEQERQKIIAESRELLDRPFQPHQPIEASRPQFGRSIEQWRAEVEQQERKFARARAQRRSQTDAEREREATSFWQNWVGGRIREAMTTVARAIAEEVNSHFEDLSSALARRDQKIEKLEVELARMAATVGKLEVKVLQAEVDADRRRSSLDAMPPPSRGLN